MPLNPCAKKFYGFLDVLFDLAGGLSVLCFSLSLLSVRLVFSLLLFSIFAVWRHDTIIFGLTHTCFGFFLFLVFFSCFFFVQLRGLLLFALDRTNRQTSSARETAANAQSTVTCQRDVFLHAYANNNTRYYAVDVVWGLSISCCLWAESCRPCFEFVYGREPPFYYMPASSAVFDVCVRACAGL